jgi:hypothetical protein
LERRYESLRRPVAGRTLGEDGLDVSRERRDLGVALALAAVALLVRSRLAVGSGTIGEGVDERGEVAGGADRGVEGGVAGLEEGLEGPDGEMLVGGVVAGEEAGEEAVEAAGRLIPDRGKGFVVLGWAAVRT